MSQLYILKPKGRRVERGGEREEGGGIHLSLMDLNKALDISIWTRFNFILEMLYQS